MADLNERVKMLETTVQMLMAERTQLYGQDRYIFQKDLQIFDGKNIQLSKGTGTQIGTETTQKLGFFAATPVSQQSAPSAQTVVGTDTDASARTAINTLRTALINLGLIA